MRKKGRNDGQGSSDVRTWRLNLATDGASADGNGMEWNGVSRRCEVASRFFACLGGTVG